MERKKWDTACISAPRRWREREGILHAFLLQEDGEKERGYSNQSHQCPGLAIKICHPLAMA